MIILLRLLHNLRQRMDMVYGAIALSEPSWFGWLEVIQTTCKTVCEDPQVQFINIAQKRDGSIVLQQGVITFLEEPHHGAYFACLRRDTLE